MPRHERHENDLYITPDWVAEHAVSLGISYLPYPAGSAVIFEPGCGPTAPFLKAAHKHITENNQPCVPAFIGQDIQVYQPSTWVKAPPSTPNCVFGFTQQDYLSPNYTPPPANITFINPPFKHAEEFIIRSLLDCTQPGAVIVVLLRLSMLAGQARYYNLWRPNMPQRPAQLIHVEVLSKRPTFTDDRKTDAKTDYALFVFQRTTHQVTQPTIGWYLPEGPQANRTGTPL